MRVLTGEPVPVEVAPGDAVAGATVNAGGRLVIRATRVGADTALAQIGRSWDGQARAVLVVADTITSTSAEAISGLRKLGPRCFRLPLEIG